MPNNLDAALLPLPQGQGRAHVGVVIPGPIGQVPPGFTSERCVSRTKKIGKISVIAGLALALFFCSIRKITTSNYTASLATEPCDKLGSGDTLNSAGLCLTLLCSTLMQDPMSSRVSQFIDQAYSTGHGMLGCGGAPKVSLSDLFAFCKSKQNTCHFDFKSSLHDTDFCGVQFGCSKPSVQEALLVFGGLIGASVLTLILLSHLKDFASHRIAVSLSADDAVPVRGEVVESDAVDHPDFYDAPQLQPYSPA